MMTERNQANDVTRFVFAVLFAVGGLINIPNLSFASPSSSEQNKEVLRCTWTKQ